VYFWRELLSLARKRNSVTRKKNRVLVQTMPICHGCRGDHGGRSISCNDVSLFIRMRGAQKIWPVLQSESMEFMGHCFCMMLEKEECPLETTKNYAFLADFKVLIT
jgi:hypothetical protein